jgi:hypothetical protein
MAEAVRSHSTISFSKIPPSIREVVRAHIVFEDIIRDQGFVDTRVFIGLQMYQSIFRDTLVRRLFFEQTTLANSFLNQGRYALLLGVIGVFGVVTGGGSRAACDSVFTASKFRGRMVA